MQQMAQVRNTGQWQIDIRPDALMQVQSDQQELLVELQQLSIDFSAIEQILVAPTKRSQKNKRF